MNAHDDEDAPAAVPPPPAPPGPPPGPTPPAPPPTGPARPRRRNLAPQDLDALDFILEVFLPEAYSRGLPVPTPPEVRPLLDDLAAEARAAGLVQPYGSAPTGWGRPSTARRPAPAALRPTPPATLPSTGPATLRPTPPTPPGAPVRPPARPPVPPARPAGLPAPAPAMAPPASAPGWARPEPQPGGGPAPWAPPRPPAPPRPSPVREWWSRVGAAVGSDLGVHGLAYLGVLLLFVGVFGLVAFAFGEVTPSLRPVAELAVAVVPFVGARLLLGHGAAVAGRALEVTGGLLLPIMLVTSQVDGYPVPPNPRGVALVISLTAVCLLCAGAYAAWSARHPASGLRYAVAPVLWLAAAMATIGVGRPMPAGQDIAVPSSAQTAAMALALVATLVVARRGTGVLATASRSAARSGIVVVALLAILTWAADGAPPVAVAVGGLALLAALELLRPAVPDDLADVLGPIWLGGVALTVGADTTTAAPTAAATALAMALLVERAGRRGAPGWVLALPASGVAIAILTLWPASWWTVGTVAAALVWTVARRVRPFDAPGSAAALDVAVAIAPAVLAGAVGAVVEPWVGVVTGAVLVVAATLPASVPVGAPAPVPVGAPAPVPVGSPAPVEPSGIPPVPLPGAVPVADLPARTGVGRLLRPASRDVFWMFWWRWAIAAAALVAAGTWPEAATEGRWAAVLALAALGAVAVVGPVPAVVAPWSTTALLGSAWLFGTATADAAPWLRGGVLALAGFGMVLAARSRPAPADGAPRASLGAAGHVLGLVAVTFVGVGWGLVVAAALAVVGWVVTAVRGERDAPDAVGLPNELRASGLSHLPWTLVGLGLPGVVGLALDTAGILTAGDTWRVLVPAATAVAYAAVSRLTPRPRPHVVSGVLAIVAALLAPAFATGPWPAVAGLAALVLAVALLPRDVRPTPVVWVAWLAVAPLVGILADRLWPAFRGLPAAAEVAWVLAVVGSVLVVAGTAVLGRRRPLGLGAADPARGVGVIDLALALAAVAVVPQPDAGRIVLVVCGAVLVLAVQTGVGVLAGVALPGAWGGVVSLAWPTLDRAPVVCVGTAVVLLVAAEVLHHLVPGRTGVRRWDVPVLAAAAAPAVTALVAADGAALTPTYVAVGLLLVGVAVRTRSAGVPDVLGATGALLVLVGASVAGTGWLALALLALAAGHTGLAARGSAGGAERTARQVVGVVAAVAAWGVAISWAELAARPAVDLTAVLAAVVILLAGAAARIRRLDRSWPLVWGAAALAVLITAVGAALTEGVGVGPAVVAAVAAVVPAALLAAGPLRLTGLRDVAAFAALGAVLLALVAISADGPSAVLVLGVVAVVTAGVAVPLAGRADVVRPLVEVSVGASVAAVVIVLAAPSDLTLFVPVLAVAAVQAAALGVAARSLGLRLLSPVLGCAAWLGAVAAPERAPEWYTVAAGLTLLVVVAIWRRDLRSRGLPAGPPEVAATDLVGIALIVVASLVRAISVSPLHAVVAIGLGVAVALWGVTMRVRRRLWAGVVVVGVAVVLLVAVPLVRILPSWGGAGAWILLAVLGLVAVLVATFLERGRTAARSAAGRVERLTAGWE